MQIEAIKQPVNRTEAKQGKKQPDISSSVHQRPAWKHKGEIQELYDRADNFLITGGTGSGKTSMVGPILLEHIPASDRIILTQPRTKATVSMAKHVSDIVGTKLGDTVGFHYRRRGRESDKSRMVFTTDGSLNSMLANDPTLADYSVAIVDEVDDPSTNIVVTLAQLLRAQELRKGKLPPLKIIPMSATADTEKLMRYLPDAQKVEIEGKMFDVTPIHSDRDIDARDMPLEAALTALHKILLDPNKKDGDLLIFMSGKREIQDTEKALVGIIGQYAKAKEVQELINLGIIDKSGKLNIDIIPYHAQESEEKLNRALGQGGKRKIVIATNAAQTSLTFKNLKYVIDSGLAKQKYFDVRTGIESLKLIKCAKNSLKQRQGRAGRVQAGEYYALFTQQDHESRPDHEIPEIQRSDLTNFVLTLKKSGIESLSELKFIDEPSADNLAYAIKKLKEWGTLDKDDNLTGEGKLMAEMGIDPRYAYLVMQGIKYGCVEQTCMIASYLSLNKERTVIPDKKLFQNGDKSDFHTILNFWQQLQQNKDNPSWLESNNLNEVTIENLLNTKEDLLKTLTEKGVPVSSDPDLTTVNKAIIKTFIDRLLVYDNATGSYHSPDYSISGIKIDKWDSSLLGKPHELIIIGDEQDSSYAKLAHQVELPVLGEIAPEMLSYEVMPLSYDPKLDQIVENTRIKLKDTHIYSETSKQIAGERAVEIFAQAIADNQIAHKVIDANNQAVATINETRMNNSEYSRTQEFTKDKLTAFYRERLGSISSVKELNEALQKGQLNLTVNPQDFLIREKPVTISRRNSGILGRIRNFIGNFASGLRNFFSGGRPPLQPQNI